MRLLNTSTLQLEEFLGEIPPYAILSHTWDDGEVLFQDMQAATAQPKKGFEKITMCCKLAASNNHRYIWIDTCCIDKSSSAELSEAINSMFSYYQRSSICYVYLDVEIAAGHITVEGLQRARWSYRGWTLQELIAPTHVHFYDQNWKFLGTRGENSDKLALVTGIHCRILDPRRAGTPPFLDQFSVADRMSWASKRQTTRPEDIAYCLFGIFDVNLPPLYGEGAIKAFLRLQEEIIRMSMDLSLLAWSTNHLIPSPSWFRGMGGLATLPACFVGGRPITVLKGEAEPFKMTNKGLRVRLPIIKNQSTPTCIAVLPNCYYFDNNRMIARVGVRLSAWRFSSQGESQSVWYRKNNGENNDDSVSDVIPVSKEEMKLAQISKIYIAVRLNHI